MLCLCFLTWRKHTIPPGDMQYHFCKLRRIHNDPVLYLYGSPIPVFEESKFLGVIFDRKLSFIPHIRYIKAKCLKALNLLKVLSNTSWGADRFTLLHLYRSLIGKSQTMDLLCMALPGNPIYKC